MGILENLARSAGVLSSEAKKTYDAKKLERRIKDYHKEETELYTRLGRMLYQSRGAALNDGELTAIFENLDAIKSRLRHLEKLVTDIRKPETEEYKYQRLSRKESDLTITRTSEGIRLIRLCPGCGSVNSPDDRQCVQCKHPFEPDGSDA